MRKKESRDLSHSQDLEYPSCLQAETPSQLFQSSEQTVLHTPPFWTCSTELLPLRRTDRKTDMEMLVLTSVHQFIHDLLLYSALITIH